MNTSLSPLSYRERCCLYFLQGTELIGNATIRRLYDAFGSYEAIYEADSNVLKAYLTDDMLERFNKDRTRKDIVLDFEKLRCKNIKYIHFDDKAYPEKLRHIPNPPIALLVNGNLPVSNIPSVAIIGARRCSGYGSYMAREYATAIASKGIQIISGMAAGIDGIAGSSALSGGFPSYAVLGCGPDICYPKSNEILFDKLKNNGGIISEYCLGTPGIAWHFPMRNRIISGLSDAVLVIEAKEKSGTLITVDAALEQGRDIYALPGRTCDELSYGCNNLIKQGAGVLLTPEDFLEEFTSNLSLRGEYSSFTASKQVTKSKNGKKIIFSSPEEKIVYDALDVNPKSMAEIVNSINVSIPMPLPIVLQRLTNLCMEGYAENISGTNYRLKC